MKIRSAEFIKSAVHSGHYPAGNFPEIAFSGRSNAGKSSVINTLVNRKQLVKTSGTPGKTQQLNFFLINGNLMFADLPGYGYAKVPIHLRKNWKRWVEAYLQHRLSLKGVVLVMDIRRVPGREELDLIRWLALQGRPCLGVLTKADKLPKARQLRQQLAASEALAVDADSLILFSSKTGQGKKLLWDAIEACLETEHDKS